MSSDISEESLLSSALDNYILENYDSALTQLNSLINKGATSQNKSEYLLYRAVCLYKQGKFDDSLKDLDEIEKDANFKKEQNYYLTRGKVLYYLCKFEDSKKALNTGLELNKNSISLFNDWMKKVEDELKQ